MPSNGPDHDSVDLRSLLATIWRRKLLIVAAFLIGAAVAYLLVMQVTPKYTARASVMLDPRTVQVMSSDEVVSDLTINNPLLDTEAAVLRSNLLLEQVIKGLDPALLQPLDPANVPPGVLDTVKGLIKGVLGGGGEKAGGNSGTEATPEMTEEDLRLRRLGVALRQAMTVWREGQSYIISVSVETESPTLSATLANAIVSSYIDGQIEYRTEAVRGASTFLAERVDSMREAVIDAEAAVEDFRSNQLAEAGVTPEAVQQQLQDLSTQLALAGADLATAEARFQQIQTVIDADGFAAGADLLSSPFVVSLREELSKLEREDANLATRLGLDHPDRQKLAASIELISADLRSEVRKIVATLKNEVEVAKIRAASIQTSLTEVERRSTAISRASLDLRQLEREAEAVRASYESTLVRLNETRSIEQLQRADARIVERAVVPGAASSPRVLLFTALGGTVGFFFGLVAVFVISVTSAGFMRIDAIERATGMPVLTSLPKGPWSSIRGMLRTLHQSPYQNFAERLRRLRTTALGRVDGRQGRRVLITSSLAGEGKSTTSVALAYVEGLARRSCVLLDFDLRRSNLAQQLGYAPKGDLSIYLQGKCTLDDVIYRVPEAGFDLITTKRPEPRLTDEATSAQLEALLTELQSRYDIVLIDTPPLLLVADTLRLAKLADTVLLLVRQGVTRRRAVLDSVRSLERAGVRSVGIAMTLVDPHSESEDYGISATYEYEKSPNTGR